MERVEYYYGGRIRLPQRYLRTQVIVMPEMRKSEDDVTRFAIIPRFE